MSYRIVVPRYVPSMNTLVFFLNPEVPGFCPSMGFVGVVSTVKSACIFTMAADDARKAPHKAKPPLRHRVMSTKRSKTYKGSIE